MVLLSLPGNTQASVFSFVGKLFSTASASGIVEDAVNSQKIALLQPALNSNPVPSLESSELAIVEGALLPENGPEGTAVSHSSHHPSSDQISLYTVREGDNLSTIADMFDVSVNTIRWANNLKAGSPIQKGDVLIILPITGVKYVVKKGDTVQSIAKAYGSDADEITNFNGLNGALIVGKEIIIPDGEAGSQSSGSSGASSGNSLTKAVNKITTAVTGGKSSSGYFRAPLDRYTKTQGVHGHNGVDLAAPVGTPLHAAAAGTVLISSSGSWGGGYGTYVVISHSNGTQTLYGHMKNTTVSVGEHVEKGEVIGYVGMTGQTSGAHVHFEVRGGKNPF